MTAQNCRIEFNENGGWIVGLIVLDNIPWKVDVNRLLERFRLQPGSQDAMRVEELAREAQEIGRPKVLYKEAHIDDRGEDYVVVDGIKLTSRILSINLEHVHRVFPYVATCGTELEEWSKAMDDILESYWVEGIKEMALAEASMAFDKHLEENFRPGKTSSMNPGSLEDWPITQQTQLFRILDDPKRYIGVELTDSYLMVPMKSVSGIRFATQVDYVNCKLCTRENCPNRRAPYDPEFAKSYGK